MALIGIAFGAGFTLGPLIAYFGLALFDQQPWGVGALASALSFVALLVAIAIFKETRNPNNKAGKEFFSISKTKEVLRMPMVGTLVLIYFLAICRIRAVRGDIGTLHRGRVRDVERRQLPGVRDRRRGADGRRLAVSEVREEAIRTEDDEGRGRANDPRPVHAGGSRVCALRTARRA